MDWSGIDKRRTYKKYNTLTNQDAVHSRKECRLSREECRHSRHYRGVTNNWGVVVPGLDEMK